MFQERKVQKLKRNKFTKSEKYKKKIRRKEVDLKNES